MITCTAAQSGSAARALCAVTRTLSPATPVTDTVSFAAAAATFGEKGLRLSLVHPLLHTKFD